MSYRLIDSNAIAEKYPEVNDLPCVYADLPNGLDGGFITQQWIPCSERMPEKYIGEWLCCTDDGQILVLPYDTPGDGSKECVFYRWDDKWDMYETYNVVAWMPLPEPWKGEQS